MSEPLNQTDKFVRQYDSSSEMGAWIGKFVYEDELGNEYTICCDQDGEEWIEE
jgi:hypothetical protein